MTRSFLLLLTAIVPSVSLGAPPDINRILADSRVVGGLVVHIGCGDGKLTADLCQEGRFLVQGLDSDPKNVAAARHRLSGLGIYGKVSVAHFEGDCLPYVDNLVNLIVVQDQGELADEEIRRVLAPGGVRISLRSSALTLEPSKKPRPAEIDEWTHYLYDASGNAVSGDQIVGPARYLKWVAGPLWSRSHEYTPSLAAMVSTGGRIFSIHDDGVRGVTDRRIGDRWIVHARDAFNGLPLWQRPMSEGWGAAAWGGAGNWSTPMSIPRRLVAAGDRVYVTLGYRSPVTMLDAVTGEVIRELDNTENTDEMVLSGKTLLVRRRTSLPNYSLQASAWKVQWRTERELPAATKGDETIVAVNVENGKTLWQWEDSRIVTLSLAAWQGRVCYHNFDELVCLDLDTGQQLWRADCPSWPDLVGTSGTLVMYEDMVFFAADRGLHALSASDGKLLWKGPRVARTGIRHTADLQIADGLLWSGITPDMPTGTIPKEISPFAVARFSGRILQGLDPRTGQVKRRVDIGNLMSDGHHIRCYRSKGTDRYLMWPKRGTEFVDVVGGKNHMRTDWLRGECSYGVMPADGLVFVPPHPCICYPGVKLDGFFAASEDPVAPAASDDEPRLLRGLAYSMTTTPKETSPEDWPMYRHDVARSGAMPSAVSHDLTTSWKKHLGGRLTQNVIVAGRVLLASVDAHTVYALDADSGQTLWSYVAGGRIDSTPTVSRGRVLFGSHDGYVYCLRAADGALAWRFRAAPVETRLTAFGQLESPWPVLGSVLVHHGVAYVSAGRSSFLDGGLYVFGLDIQTGTVVHRRHLKGPWPDIAQDVGQPYAMTGAKADLFVYNGTSLSMGPREFTLELADYLAFNPEGGENYSTSSSHLMAGSGLLDDTWHDRTFWMHSRVWPGRNVFKSATVAPKTGQLLVFDASTTYAIKAFIHKHSMSPRHVPGQGYGLIADANDNEPGKNFARTEPPKWKALVPVRAHGLLLADDTLFLAGCRDVILEDDPAAAYEGRAEATLWAVSTANGKKIAEYELDAPPVNDGMSAARGRLFISSTDGTVTCLANRELDLQ